MEEWRFFEQVCCFASAGLLKCRECGSGSLPCRVFRIGYRVHATSLVYYQQFPSSKYRQISKWLLPDQAAATFHLPTDILDCFVPCSMKGICELALKNNASGCLSIPIHENFNLPKELPLLAHTFAFRTRYSYIRRAWIPIVINRER